MADYAAVNGVAPASIDKINGVAKASVQAVNGATTPSSGATQWALSAADARVGYCGTDLTSWTTYQTVVNEGDDYRTIAYGKDGSGNPLWVVGWSQNPKEIMYTSDITNTSGWSDVNLAGGIHDVCWGNDVWIAVGNNTSGRKAVYRSTDGASWSEVDISGVTGVDSTTIYCVGNSGSKWLIAQDDRLYSSSDGSTWALAHDFNDAGIDKIYDLKYTNNTWILLVIRNSGGGGSGPYVTTAAASDLTDWSTEQDINIGKSTRRFAAGNGKAIFVYSNDHQVATVSGKTCTLAQYTANQLPEAGSRDIATDGSTWVVVCDGGHVLTSTDDGSNWTHSVDGLQIDGDVDNLDAVAANVYLPV